MEETNDLVDQFIGIVRGRSVNSTCGRTPTQPQRLAARKAASTNPAPTNQTPLTAGTFPGFWFLPRDILPLSRIGEPLCGDMGQKQGTSSTFSSRRLGVTFGLAITVLAAVGGCSSAPVVPGPALSTEPATAESPPESLPSQVFVPSSSSALPPDTGFSAVPPPISPTATAAVLYGCDAQPVAQPEDFILLCGDAGETLVHLAWSGWGESSASATGQLVVKSCTPDCADGASIPYVATVTVTDLSGGSYTRMHISAPQAPVPAQNFAVDTQGPVTLTRLPTGY